ncbi:MAG: wax ester/triacylglycerol synthase family O-acyltransferase [Aquihabitans sp.]
MRYLGGMDTMFVRAETRSMLLHVTGVLILDPKTSRIDTRQQVRDLIAARVPALPPLRWRLIDPPGGIGSLRWIEDPDFNLDDHVYFTSTPPPGTRTELEAIVAEVAGTPLDRDRPLWEMHVIDGLEDGSVAVVWKFHHAFMDGGGGMGVIGCIFDLDPDADPPALLDLRQAEAVPSRWDLLVDTPRELLFRLGQVPSAAMSTVAGIGGLLGSMFPGRSTGNGTSLAPRSPYNGRLSDDRVVALGDASLVDVKKIKTAFDVTVNDVVLAAVASSLRDHLGSDVATAQGPLTAAVPVSVRPEGMEDDFGNHTSAMMVSLPTDLEDPVARLTAIHESSMQTKEQHRAMGPDLLEQWAGLIPPWLISAGADVVGRFGLGSHLPTVFNVIVSNVAGPPVPIYLAGAEVTAIYPIGPLMEGGGLNISVISRRDRIHIGVVGDPTLVTDPSAITTGFARAIDQLLDSAPSKPRSPRSRGPARTAKEA